MIILGKIIDGIMTPEDEYIDDYISLKENTLYKVEIKKSRDIKFHKKYMKLISVIFEFQETYKHKDHLRKEITKHLGYYEEYKNMRGEIVKEAKSVSFAKMDNLEFEKLYNSTIDEGFEILRHEGKTEKMIEEYEKILLNFI